MLKKYSLLAFIGAFFLLNSLWSIGENELIDLEAQKFFPQSLKVEPEFTSYIVLWDKELERVALVMRDNLLAFPDENYLKIFEVPDSNTSFKVSITFYLDKGNSKTEDILKTSPLLIEEYDIREMSEVNGLGLSWENISNIKNQIYQESFSWQVIELCKHIKERFFPVLKQRRENYFYVMEKVDSLQKDNTKQEESIPLVKPSMTTSSSSFQKISALTGRTVKKNIPMGKYQETDNITHILEGIARFGISFVKKGNLGKEA